VTEDAGADAVRLTAELVAVDSVNPGLVPGAAGERRIVDHLQPRLEVAGLRTTVVPGAGRVDRPSLVAVPEAAANGPTVVLNGHLDTVGVLGMTAPFSPRIEDERLSGRGAADMKGGIAGIVVAAERLIAAGAPVRPVLALVADEEDASIGSEAVIRALPDLGIDPDVCLVAEPTDLAVARTLRGFALVRVRFEGRAAHSSQPELGSNAVTYLGRFLAAVDERAPSVRRAGGELLVTIVHGGESPFVVPAHAECLVERRTVPGERSADVLAEVQVLLDPAWHATAELVAAREPWALDSEGPAAELAGQLAAGLATGATFDAPYWMEAALWQDVCPTLVCGPSGGGLHAVDEWVDLRQVRRFADALVSTLEAPANWWRSAG
jgi:acetylornithine deacetylase